jgi:6-phosphofructokinase 1
MAKRIGIITSGGDCPGLNAVIESVVKSGIKQGYEMVGIREGLEGLITDPVNFIEFNEHIVDGIKRNGGTILFAEKRATSRKRFKPYPKKEQLKEVLEDAEKNMKKLNLDSLIIIGGNGTITAASLMAEHGIKVIGVPKTIDNDLSCTDKTFGFSTAVDYVSGAIDRIHTTAHSHKRVFVVETMGKHAGWIALMGGFAGGANIILLPEIQFSYEKVVKLLKSRKENQYACSIIAVAEAASAADEDQVFKDTEDQIFGGVSARIMKGIENVAPGEFEMRNVVLGHLQRGGSPNAEDRILAQRFGVSALRATMDEDFGKMVSLRGNKIQRVELHEAIDELKVVDPKSNIIRTIKETGVSFGDE